MAYGNIIPSRGLRQGDPLSLYLFLLCAEGFTSLLFKAEYEGKLHGVQICRRVPSISNLLFADDSLIFCQANQEEVKVISDTLQLHAEASGQCINFEKSSVYFSGNTFERQKQWIKKSLGVKEVDRFYSYLGLPTLVGRAKYQTFAYIKERVWKELQGWKGRMLSRVGKEVLIKAVSQTIPTYTMGVFLLPAKLCNELDALCARFWWGQTGDERKIHWKSWSFLTKPKKVGGMGFQDLRSFNLAMLAKQGWQMLQDQNSLLSKCFKAKYFPICSFMEVVDYPNSSYIWKSVLAAQQVLKKWCYWRAGTGSKIRVMEDKWIPNRPTNKIIFPTEYKEWEWRVSDLIDWRVHQWDRERIYMIFDQFDAEAILRIPLSRRQVQDKMVWMYCRNGIYTVKSGYHVARMLDEDANGREESLEQRVDHRVWTQIWKLQNWKPPTGQMYKLNFDAATFANGLGVGAVICNSAGDVMAALSAKGAAVVDSEEAKALACQKAMGFAINARFLELIVEGDNAMVMSAISSKSLNWSCLGVIYDDIGFLAAELHYVAFNCIRRSANFVAHSLARYANVLTNEVVWLEDSPPPAREALYFDSSSLIE
ncbi:uncharacterized protein LOC142608925 [Castanea sativa]|uniref:uncharacterized protein LOC142608925 n=1 Tax=Castanea sativa TaxID=21020 RepID=UPI003F64D174